jgi:hydrogenase expression/formation protein
MDLEGFAKRGLLRGDPDLEERLVEMIVEVKGDRITRSYAKKLAEAVLVEARSTLSPEGDVFDLSVAGVTMGDFGVGSRGLGDFYAHEKIAEVIGETDAVVTPGSWTTRGPSRPAADTSSSPSTGCTPA